MLGPLHSCRFSEQLPRYWKDWNCYIFEIYWWEQKEPIWNTWDQEPAPLLHLYLKISYFVFKFWNIFFWNQATNCYFDQIEYCILFKHSLMVKTFPQWHGSFFFLDAHSLLSFYCRHQIYYVVRLQQYDFLNDNITYHIVFYT